MMEKKDILIIHGTDYKNMAIRILKRAGLAELIGDRNKKIGLKPNLVVVRDPSEGATTHSEILEGYHPKAADMVEFLEKEWICTHKQPMWNYAGIVSRFECEKRYEGKIGNIVNI